MICGVENLVTEAQAVPFIHQYGLVQSRIEIQQAGTGEGVAAEVAIVAGVRERVRKRVEVSRWIAQDRRGAGQIRALSEVHDSTGEAGPIEAHERPERLPALHAAERMQFPSTQNARRGSLPWPWN